MEGHARSRLSSAAPALIMLALAVFVLAFRSVTIEPGAGAAAIQSSSLGKLVYVVDGDLWAKELPDGVPVQLTDAGVDFAPQWSPSGKWLAYRKSIRNDQPETWVMRSDGSSARELDLRYQSPNVDSIWSPVDDRLAFVSSEGNLVAEDADGRNRALLVRHDGANSADRLSSPVWSPDGASLAFARESRPSYEGLWRVDVASSRAIEVYNYLPPQGQIVPSRWSADNSTIYFWRSPIYSASIMADGLPLWSIPAAGGDAKDLGMTTLLYEDYVRPTESGLAVVAGGGRDSTANKKLVLIDFSARAAELTVDQSIAISPDAAPDGSSIALAGAPAVPRFGLIGRNINEPLAWRRIWLIDSDGSNPRRLTDREAAEEAPEWSHDSRALLYVQPSLRIDSTASIAGGMIRLYDLEAGRGSDVAEARLDLSSTSGAFYYGHVDWGALYDWWQPR